MAGMEEECGRRSWLKDRGIGKEESKGKNEGKVGLSEAKREKGRKKKVCFTLN